MTSRIGFATRYAAEQRVGYYSTADAVVEARDGSWLVAGERWIEGDGVRGRTYYGPRHREVPASDVAAGQRVRG